MGNLIGNELLGALISTLIGSLLTIFVYWSRKIYEYIKTRNVRRFWRPFLQKKISIVITEYKSEGNDRFSNIAQIAGTGWLITKGMALSLAHLLDFCESKITKRTDLIVLGDRTGNLETPDAIILGSPANNRFSKTEYDHLSKMYDIPYKIIWDDDGIPIEISTITGEKFSPLVENGFGNDYALVIKADKQLVPQKSLLIIAGCYMWGTKAATEAVTEAKILNVVANETKNSSNVAFIIKTRVVNDASLGPEIEIDNQRFICTLNYKEKVAATAKVDPYLPETSPQLP